MVNIPFNLVLYPLRSGRTKTYVWSGHEALAYHIAEISNVTIILAVNRAPMSHIPRIIVVSNCRTASTDVSALVNSQTVLPGVQTVQGSIYNARF